MIGRLHGQLLEKKPPLIVIDVHGVGYELEASMNTLLALPAPGETVRLYTHLSVREDAHLLYGFIDETERRLFRELIRISGVGPRLALAILSGMDRQQFMKSVMEDDTKTLTRLPGVGKKTAERLIIEMRDRFKHWPEFEQMEQGVEEAELPLESDNHADAEAALIALGYKPTEAARMLSGLDTAQSTEALIKAALSDRLAGGDMRSSKGRAS
ncbi:Holliday junction branch migration protein RuvA [Kushneria marisflavi]|uniref:Holliday junction branch migration complex subunit RuvA n=1 Tax=Kushneria marisflavi TaxID=157779 RepID=A0A240UKR0_9GAMM|nr:Holliday junction branch migration protein RuvA [Kushneria marisflavi]ART61663.1 Holliday junction branch migration protein RuvA [Kushneria marisflavi]RKD86676.1 Holliday junction DNA helicase subunit RuvA [Kushneria marisflavi]